MFLYVLLFVHMYVSIYTHTEAYLIHTYIKNNIEVIRSITKAIAGAKGRR